MFPMIAAAILVLLAFLVAAVNVRRAKLAADQHTLALKDLDRHRRAAIARVLADQTLHHHHISARAVAAAADIAAQDWLFARATLSLQANEYLVDASLPKNCTAWKDPGFVAARLLADATAQRYNRAILAPGVALFSKMSSVPGWSGKVFTAC